MESNHTGRGRLFDPSFTIQFGSRYQFLLISHFDVCLSLFNRHLIVLMFRTIKLQRGPAMSYSSIEK